MRSHVPHARFPLAALLSLLLVLPAAAGAQVPTIEEKTEGMEEMEGFFTIYWDEATGDLYWEIDRWEEEFLCAVGLSSGLGSNAVGLDRGQRGRDHVLAARRVGPRVLLVEPNYRYRARSDNPREVKAVEDAFAPSTHWGFEIVAESGDRVLVDATDFFMRDAHDIASTLPGGFQLDRSRSVFHLPRTKAFPKNTEIEVSQTFTSREPGGEVRSAAASGDAVTLRVHHSLVELPNPGYEPRAVDPRVNAFGITFHDYAAPIDEELEVRWVNRHRLERKDPSARRSEAVEPIVYYVDPGAPEPIRSALVEGASWWNQAFEAAGYIDAFQVRVLPEDADPMDLRYNMIHWTHRSTRGWSYGGSVSDPRTGEILKGNVNLGSLRLRQDVLLAQGLIPPYGSSGPDGAGVPPLHDGQSISGCSLAGTEDFGYLAAVAEEDPVEMALARVRQLSAHEVGHTLGFAHNYMASTYAGRASVMDYPAPLVGITSDGRLDLSDAYAVGIGEFDEFAVTWLYSHFPEDADEEAELERIVQDGLERGMRFISDADARPLGAAHPYTALWDNGTDPVDHLAHEIRVRRIGLEQFGEQNIRAGEPMAGLEEVLVPLYLHHRYQLEAAMHSLGGADYNYALRGDGQMVIEVVDPNRQRRALSLGLSTLRPDFLALPERVLQLIPPRAFGMTRGETFAKRTSPTFDPIGVAETAAEMAVGMILQPQRMARLVEFHSRDAENPGLEETVDALLDATWYAEVPSDACEARIQESVRYVVARQMMQQAASGQNTAQVRSVLNSRLYDLVDRLNDREERTPFEMTMAEEIGRWMARAQQITDPAATPEAPPGSPIGQPGHRPPPGG
ncbi:MAG: zinc-dependent metalloprotease [bacterium]